jgi:DNA-binding GntR family transcriptional regulator
LSGHIAKDEQGGTDDQRERRLSSSASKVATVAPAGREPPRYQQLAGELRRKILAGAFASDFPTEGKLCQQYGLSRFTVREALRRLQGEGLIARRRGSGTVVQPAAARGGALHQPLSNVGELLQYAQGSRIHYAPCGRGALPRGLRAQIGAVTSGVWSGFVGLRHAEGDPRPIARIEAWFPAALDDAVARLDLNAGLLFGQMEHLAGISVGRVTQDIQAMAATSALADALGLRRGAPVLRIIRCYHDQDGRLFEVSVNHHPGDRFAYSMHIDVDA